MTPPTDCYLRLFDVDKYREIQPVIEGIVKRNIKTERVISVIRTAQNVITTDDFKKYNDEDDYDDYTGYFSGILEMLENNNISMWFKELDTYTSSANSILRLIIVVICCPKYQWNDYERQGEEISGTTVDYTNFYWSYGAYYGLNLIELLNFSNIQFENFPFKLGDPAGFYNRQQLTQLAEAAIDDLNLLPRSETSSDEYHQNAIAKYLKFYDDLNFLLELANISGNYTILNEQL